MVGWQIVGRDRLDARHELAILARPRLLAAAVEEVGHMGVLLRLGDVELGPAGFGYSLGERGTTSGPKTT